MLLNFRRASKMSYKESKYSNTVFQNIAINKRK